MKILKNLFYLFSFLLVLTTTFSCEGDDPINEPAPGSNESINNWILGNMKSYYLWTEQIPNVTDNSISPDKYFNSLLYKAEDRFSWIQENFIDLMEQLSGVVKEAGYDYSLSRTSEFTEDVIGIINYVKPNSPAANNNLKRGDIFSAINGTRITMSNYQNLLDALSSPHTLGIIDYSKIGQEPVILDPVKSISLSTVRYEENPMFLDTVYNIAGKKIGYLVYNFFAEDNGDNSITYVKELNTVFGKLKSSGIQELILDLRYNSGGAVITCVSLASMISNRSKPEVFAIEQYNKYLSEYGNREYGPDYDKYFFVNNLERYDDNNKLLESVPVNKISGLTRLYIITSNRTASASELIINGLKPYMNVVLIGETTYGKNVGSVTLYEGDAEKQKTNKWGLQPIVVKFANKNGYSDYTQGFNPDVEISEYNKLPLMPLGNTDEPMLQAALVKIGVKQAQANLRADKKNTFIYMSSSIDKTPARKNMYVKPEKLHIK